MWEQIRKVVCVGFYAEYEYILILAHSDDFGTEPIF